MRVSGRGQGIDVVVHLQPLQDDLDRRRSDALAAGRDQDGQLGLGLWGLALTAPRAGGRGRAARRGPRRIYGSSAWDAPFFGAARPQGPMLGQRPGRGQPSGNGVEADGGRGTSSSP
ncbi:MAG: hypothetical protein MZV63_58650 [Marinilabiliales bacterium]|nr:hypothetical protein [Marinilabiliales bacterium]